MKDYSTLFMEIFVQIVDQHRIALKLKNPIFAQKCWPESTPASAGLRWRAIRVRSRWAAKPQKVLLSDAQSMATALNIDISYIMLEATDRLNEIKIKDLKNQHLTENND